MKDFGSANYILTTTVSNSGEVTISAAVKGFWSMDTISAYVRCQSFKGIEWTYSISTSSGGRDPNVVESDIEAYANYAEALLAVTQELEKHKANAAERTAMFQAYLDKIEADYEAQKKAKQEAWESETPIPLDVAKNIINELSAKAKVSRDDVGTMTIYQRGTKGTRQTDVAVVMNSRNRSFFIGCQRFSYDDLLEELTTKYVTADYSLAA